jgi:predicted  nucleic acid-binding Zn-ribbon protein
MAAELTMLSDYLNDLERERLEEAELHQSLLKSVEELGHKKRKVLETLGTEQDSIELEYHKVKSEYLKIKKTRDALQTKMDAHVTAEWKQHVHSVQASDWFSDYEKGFF